MTTVDGRDPVSTCAKFAPAHGAHSANESAGSPSGDQKQEEKKSARNCARESASSPDRIATTMLDAHGPAPIATGFAREERLRVRAGEHELS